jgi:ABC-type sugar transport system ATPase subunit
VVTGLVSGAVIAGVPDAERPEALGFVDISKDFGGSRALDGVTVSVRRGTVHAFVGANGAGKSTLMKVASGAVRPTSGRLVVNGADVRDSDPRQAVARGITMIYQELTIIPGRSALENVLLGNVPTAATVVQRRTAEDVYRRATGLVGCTVAPSARAGDLSTAQQQLLEIARALARGSDIIVMDEPTASLGLPDREQLHGAVDRLRSAGHTVLVITHDLDEVLALADHVTVMRDGRVQRTAPVAAWSRTSLVDAMLGPGSAGDRRPRRPLVPPRAASALRVTGVRSAAVDGVDLHVHAGEIVGIAGLVGSGRSSLLRAIVGADPVDSGTMAVHGRDVRWPGSSRAARRLGIGFCPEERKTGGLVLGRSAAWNIALPTLGRGLVSPARLGERTAVVAEEVGFPAARLSEPAGDFSGGNQQKLLLARWVLGRSSILVLDEPTRGMDVGAKADVFAVMSRLAGEGVAVVWTSSELEEVLEHSHRIVLMAHHRVVEPPAPIEDVAAVVRTLFDATRDTQGAPRS